MSGNYLNKKYRKLIFDKRSRYVLGIVPRKNCSINMSLFYFWSCTTCIISYPIEKYYCSELYWRRMNQWKNRNVMSWEIKINLSELHFHWFYYSLIAEQINNNFYIYLFNCLSISMHSFHLDIECFSWAFHFKSRNCWRFHLLKSW